jgi:hypothetical protein
VPDGTGIVPFPYLFIALLLSLIVLAGKIKDKTHSRWLANFLALFGILEPFVMITLLISSAVIKEYIIAAISAGALFLHYIANMIMLIYYSKRTLTDPEYSRWVRGFRKTKITLVLLGSF